MVALGLKGPKGFEKNHNSTDTTDTEVEAWDDEKRGKAPAQTHQSGEQSSVMLGFFLPN